MSIDSKKLLTNLQTKGGRGECPSCGRNVQWAAGDDSGVLLQGWDGTGNLNIGQGFPVLAMICPECGFVRLHSIPALE